MRVRPSLLMTLLASLAIGPRALGQAEITAENIRDAHIQSGIRAIVDELYHRQADDTYWEPTPYTSTVAASQSGGYSALVVLSLLYAGETYQDDRLTDAIAWLSEMGMEGTYAVAIRAHIWAMLPPKFQPNLEADRDWLIKGFSNTAKGWNYGQEPYTTRRDNSITQYGALALWEIAKRGLALEDRLWRMLEERFIELQLDDGGWNYDGTGPATGSMTTAGLTVLFITQDFLHAVEAVALSRGAGNPNQAAIDRAIRWMDANFTAETNPGRDTDYFYYMYGVERVGLASGYKFFGPHDWYRAGAAELLNRLCSWDPESRSMTVHKNHRGDDRAGEIKTTELAFALMFLSRGRVPISINKLRAEGFRWNNRPRDVANLSGRIAYRTETGLNWQIVSLEAEPEAWLDAPLLYLASNEPLPWVPRAAPVVDDLIERHRRHRDAVAAGTFNSDLPHPLAEHPELLRIKRYLDLGGTLLAVAEGRNAAFAETVEALGRILYPQYTWRDLPPDHEAYRIYQPVRQSAPRLRALSNGLRELIILSPESDFSEAFQGGAADADVRFATGMNIFLYASEMNRAKPRVERHVMAQPEVVRTASVPATVVRATHGGDWDVEPRSLETFKPWAWNERGLDVTIETRPLASIDELPTRPAVVVVTGSVPVELTADERSAIQAYVEGGGVILFENAGGTAAFAQSVEVALREMFPGRPVRSLLRHEVLTARNINGATPARRVEYRPYSREVFGSRETVARLRGIVFGDGTARIILSREDLSHALLDQPMWRISGYTTQWARELLANIVLYGRSLGGG